MPHGGMKVGIKQGDHPVYLDDLPGGVLERKDDRGVRMDLGAAQEVAPLVDIRGFAHKGRGHCGRVVAL